MADKLATEPDLWSGQGYVTMIGLSIDRERGPKLSSRVFGSRSKASFHDQVLANLLVEAWALPEIVGWSKEEATCLNTCFSARIAKKSSSRKRWRRLPALPRQTRDSKGRGVLRRYIQEELICASVRTTPCGGYWRTWLQSNSPGIPRWPTMWATC